MAPNDNHPKLWKRNAHGECISRQDPAWLLIGLFHPNVLAVVVYSYKYMWSGKTDNTSLFRPKDTDSTWSRHNIMWVSC